MTKFDDLAQTPERILKTWLRVKTAHDICLSNSAATIEAEQDAADRLAALNRRMASLTHAMAHAPARRDDELAVKLELWRLLMVDQSEDDCDDRRSAMAIVLSVAAALSTRLRDQQHALAMEEGGGSVAQRRPFSSAGDPDMPAAPATTPDPDRVLPESPHWHLPADAAEVSRIDAIEGVPMGAPVELHELIVTPTMSMVKVAWAKGSASKPHTHHDHDSVVYVISGRLSVTAEGETVEAGPGDSLTSPPGVEHAIEALEDSVSIEVKTPPVRTW